MIDIHILFVDEEENFRLVWPRIERCLRDMNVHPVVHLAETPAAAERVIEDLAEIHLAVIDLLWSTNVGPLPEGLPLLEDVRQRHPQAVNVAITTGISSMPDLEATALRKGADLFVLRASLLTRADGAHGMKEFLDALKHWLYDRGVIRRPFSVRWNSEDAGAQSIIESMSRVVVEHTLGCLVPNIVPSSDLILTYIAPGLSGAIVFGVEVVSPNVTPRNYMVKASRDVGQLRRELAAQHRMTGLYPGLQTPHYFNEQGEPFSYEGWYTICAQLVYGPSLRSWLCGADASHQSTDQFFSALLSNSGMSSGYRVKPSEFDHQAPAMRLKPPAFRRVRVEQSIHFLLEAIRYLEFGEEEIASIDQCIAAFCRNGQLGSAAVEDLPVGPLLVEAHGDLHTANILVFGGTSPRPIVVDWGSFGLHHWAEDVARLFVDIVMRCLDSGPESLFWDRLSAWRGIVRDLSICDGNVDAGQDFQSLFEFSADPVHYALGWITSHLFEIFGEERVGERLWEWHAALASQFIRGTYQSDITPPKRVLCLLAAVDQVELSAVRVPARRNY